MESLFLSETDFNEEAGRRLRLLIDALGIKYAEAARDMGLTKNHLGNMMRGSPIRLFALYKLCRRRGVGMDWVFLADPSALPKKVADRLPLFGLVSAAPSEALHQVISDENV